MRISDWSSDVCSSDLPKHEAEHLRYGCQRGHRDPGDGLGRHVVDPIDDAIGEPVQGVPQEEHEHDAGAGRQESENPPRSEERRGGNECASTGLSWWWPGPYQKKKHHVTVST